MLPLASSDFLKKILWKLVLSTLYYKNRYQGTENTQSFAKYDEMLSYNSEVAVISQIKGRFQKVNFE